MTTAHTLVTELQQIDRRDRGLWGTTLVVIVLLGIALYAVSAVRGLGQQDPQVAETIDLAVSSLFGIVLLFATFVVHQQYTIHHCRREKEQHLEEIARLGEETETLQQVAVMDPLTGLFNRRFALHELPRELTRDDREGCASCLVILDLNSFKSINDTYGHAAGDLALQAFATAVKHAIRDSDLPVRFGGDEFIVFLPHCSDAEVPQILSRLGDPSFQLGKATINVSFAAGWAEHKKGEKLDDLIQRADEALYVNKRMRGVTSARERAPSLVQVPLASAR